MLTLRAMFFRRRREADSTEPEAPLPAEGLDAAGTYALHAARFSPAQADEYRGLGPDVMLAVLAYHDGRAREAFERFETLALANPDAAYLPRDVAKARFLVGLHREALGAFRAFFTRTQGKLTRDERLEAAQELALVHDELGDVAAAIEALSAPLDDDDERPEAYLQLGRYLRMRGLFDEAREVLEPALPLEACCNGGSCGKKSDVQLELGLCRAELGDARGALELLEPLVSKAPRLPKDIAQLVSRCYKSLGRGADAERMAARGA